MESSIIATITASMGLKVAIAIAVVAIVFTVIARWMLFSKAGRRGWTSLVPVYSGYVQWSIAWKKGWLFWVALVAGVASAAVSLSIAAATLLHMYTDVQFPDMSSPMLPPIGVALSILSALLGLAAAYKLFKSFGHGFGWFMLWLFFPHVMMLVLGFGKSRYLGRQ